MWSWCLAVFACLCLARISTAQKSLMRTHGHLYNKDLTGILASLDEKLRVLDTIGATQAKQSRRLDVIQDKLDRVETTLSLKLERAQLAAERLEHRLHLLQTSIQATMKESTEKLEQSQTTVSEVAQNLTKLLDSHRHLLEKVSGAYAETWRRGLMLEAMMRDGQSLINVTRRELADGLRALARKHRESWMTSSELEAAVSRKINNNSYKIDLKIKELLEAQQRCVDSCQPVQRDDPKNVTDVLDKLFDSLINKITSTFHELQNIQSTMRNHDSKVMRILNTGRTSQPEITCRRLEAVFKNSSQSSFKESELHQLTEKFVALTDRADAALQKLEIRLGDDKPGTSDVTAAADRLLYKLNGIKKELDNDDDMEDDWGGEGDQVQNFFDDDDGDLMEEDKQLLNKAKPQVIQPVTAKPHRRHLHKHPYDRGPG